MAGAIRDVTRVLGRPTEESGPAAPLGHYRAPDGSEGAAVSLDLDRPHAGLVVGKRGSGKSYTLGVVAEGVARADGVGGVVVDPMGTFDTLAAADGVRVVEPRVPAAALPPAAWCDLLDVAPESPVGSLVWRAAGDAETLSGMRDAVAAAAADPATVRATDNHLALAASWDVFGSDVDPVEGLDDGVTVLDLSGVARPPANAVLRAVATGTYERALRDSGPLPWLFVDEAHAFADSVAWAGLREVLTRGRQPGVSLLLATQRPGTLPPVVASQVDVVLAHRLTAQSDLEALRRARPTYLRESLAERLPERPGDAVVVDDAAERAVGVRIRERETPHGGADPRASER